MSMDETALVLAWYAIPGFVTGYAFHAFLEWLRTRA
jgi:hypothetical protein